MKVRLSVATGICLLCLTATLHGVAPSQIGFQGRLTNPAGSPLVGTYSVQFKLYNVPTLGAPLWQETRSVTTNVDGFFSVLLGEVGPGLGLWFQDSARYLGITVDTDPELTPRTQLVASPFAMAVKSVHQASGGIITSFVTVSDGLHVGSDGPGSAIEAGNDITTSSYMNVGVFGYARYNTSENRGVYGMARGANGFSNSAGVYAEGFEPLGTVIWAGYFDGWANVTGTFFAATKSFRIDDPTDPENRMLQHACVESDEYKNMYDGLVTLDPDGSATITLPAWFEKLNKDFRYQLTAVGAPGPNLYIAQEVQDGSFAIAGGSPGMKVSWLVTGIRKDPYVLAHPLEVQKDKAAELRGKYLHPVEYGVSEELGVDYAARQRSRSAMENASQKK